MTIRVSDISSVIKEQIREYGKYIRKEEVGEILSVGDGIAKIHGLDGAMAGELLEFPGGVVGMAFNLEEDNVGAVIMGDDEDFKEGDEVKRTGKVASVPVGDALMGRIVDALGRPLDGRGSIEAVEYLPVQAAAPGIVEREPVSEPIQTGLKAIDALTPIGRGQRELIIGDRETGKTAIAIDTIINQREMGVYCIYVAIGQKLSAVAEVAERLAENGAMEYTTIVSAGAADPAALQFIAPYSGTAMGEYFRDRGRHALVVYDDLSKHAVAYRQISLLLRRPPGREAYPGDIFYIHSRLLERSAKLSREKGGGTLTALPIVETQAGDVTAYIPTNIISITDGQIYLEPDLFYAGIRPAINVGLSVSRVGGAAQIPAMKKVAGPLRIELAQARELEGFAQFGAELDEVARRKIARGKVLLEVMKQKQYRPLRVGMQIIHIYAAIHGYMDRTEVSKIASCLERLEIFIKDKNPNIIEKIEEEKDITDEVETEIKEIVEGFKWGE